MDLIVIGLNLKTAPIDIREKISFSQFEILRALKELIKDLKLLGDRVYG